MRSENLCKWLGYAAQKDNPDDTHWIKVVEIFQAKFRDGNISNKITRNMVVMITEGKSRYFRGVGLVEVLCKFITGLLKQRFTLAIVFHDIIHGFQAGSGMGTASLKANLLQQLTAMRGAVLHEIFLYLQNVYDSIDRYRCLNILMGYSVGTRVIWVLRTYSGRFTMVMKSGGYYGPHFKGCRFVTHGDPSCPLSSTCYFKT